MRYHAGVARSTRAPQRRALWDRTNHANGGFKDNTPGAWLDTNGPVWWVGSDSPRAMMPSGQTAGRSAITRATNLIVGRLGASSWTVASGTPRWVSDPMLCRPDERYPPAQWDAGERLPQSVFWGSWIRSALLSGMGWLVFTEDAVGQPNPGSLKVLDPWCVSPDPQHPQRRQIQWDGWSTPIPVDDENRFYWTGGRQWRLLELRNPTTPVDAYTGMTPGTLAWHAAELGLIDAQLAYAVGMYGGGGVPSGYLKMSAPQATQEQADALKEAWMTAHGGGTRQVAVLNATVDYQAIAVSPVDAAIAEMKKLSLTDVANAFGVPGYLIGAPVVGMTYSNVQMELTSLYQFTLMPWAQHVQETLSALLPIGTDLDIHPIGEDAGDVAAALAALGQPSQPGLGAPVGPPAVPANVPAG